jgi:hypothetical protein
MGPCSLTLTDAAVVEVERAPSSKKLVGAAAAIAWPDLTRDTLQAASSSRGFLEDDAAPKKQYTVLKDSAMPKGSAAADDDRKPKSALGAVDLDAPLTEDEGKGALHYVAASMCLPMAPLRSAPPRAALLAHHQEGRGGAPAHTCLGGRGCAC